MSKFEQKNSWTMIGNINKILEYRLNRKLPQCPEIGNITFKSLNENDGKWVREIIYPLNFNPFLLYLINCYKIKVVQEFYQENNKIITRFSSPKYISNFFSFEEEHVYEQLGELIIITRQCNGIDKIKKWLYFGADFYMKEVEEQFEKQQYTFIKKEIIEGSV